MKHATWALLAATLLCSRAMAADPLLWQAKRCNACHAVERKLVGPAFQDIAKRYNGSATMVDPLASKIIKGGAGAWGSVPMTANPHVSPAEARELARWILEIKPR